MNRPAGSLGSLEEMAYSGSQVRQVAGSVMLTEDPRAEVGFASKWRPRDDSRRALARNEARAPRQPAVKPTTRADGTNRAPRPCAAKTNATDADDADGQ